MRARIICPFLAYSFLYAVDIAASIASITLARGMPRSSSSSFSTLFITFKSNMIDFLIFKSGKKITAPQGSFQMLQEYSSPCVLSRQRKSARLGAQGLLGCKSKRVVHPHDIAVEAMT